MVSRGIFYNAKILDANITGVQRYLLEIAARSKNDVIRISPRSPLSGTMGHLWEQFVIPFKVRSSVLWSPSNSGPLFVRRQVVTIHDVVPLDHPEWLGRNFARWYRFLLPRLVLRAQRVIAISEFTKQRLIATTQISAQKIVVIPNGVSVRFRPHEKDEIEMMHSALSLPCLRYLLTVGSLEPRKNLRRLLAAWRDALLSIPEDIWLVVAGGKGKVLTFGGTTGVEELPPRVHLMGHVADELLPALYGGATAFAYVSEYEGFGLPPLEAMASSVPVLVSNTTAFPEVVGEAGLYANPLDVDDISKKLVTLLNDATLRDDLAARGIERAKLFTWERTAAMTLQVLREVAEEP